MLADISRVDTIYIVCGRTDMRKQIDGLCAIIEEKLHMGKDDNALFPWSYLLAYDIIGPV